MSTTTTTDTMSEMNQILKLQETIRAEYQGIVDCYSEEKGVYAESQALLNNLVIRFMDLSLKATGLLSSAQHSAPYNNNNNALSSGCCVASEPDDKTTTIDIITTTTTTDTDAIETMIARCLSANVKDDDAKE
jgi:hypothetical protein